jgi:hypothetical protein
MPSRAHEAKLTFAASTDTPGTGQKKQRKEVLSVDPGCRPLNCPPSPKKEKDIPHAQNTTFPRPKPDSPPECKPLPQCIIIEPCIWNELKIEPDLEPSSVDPPSSVPPLVSQSFGLPFSDSSSFSPAVPNYLGRHLLSVTQLPLLLQIVVPAVPGVVEPKLGRLMIAASPGLASALPPGAPIAERPSSCPRHRP